MRLIFKIVLCSILCISCAEEKTIKEELVGEWVYERETFDSNSSVDDFDTQGFMILHEDETGTWTPFNGFFYYDVEWNIQSNDQKISMTKYKMGNQNTSIVNTIFDLKRMDEDNYTLTYYLAYKSEIDTTETIENFENIILTRLE